MSFPSLNRGSCDLQPDQTQIIDPGTYGNVTVKSRSHLKLRAGTYYFTSLSLESTAVLDADNAAGPVFVNVKNAFSWNGAVTETQPTKGNVVFALATSSPINILTGMRGLLVAPAATVTISSNGATGHFGSFFARSLDLQPNATIHHRPLSPAAVCPGATDCSALCPCGPGGTCQTDAECQTGHTCQAPAGGGAKICTPISIDDGNPCTADSFIPGTGVVHTPLPTGTACADGNACNGAETCNASAVCLGGTPPVLDDGNPCTTDSCTPATGVAHAPVAAGTACIDGNACNGAEACNASATCVAGAPPPVDDGNLCTTDACDPANGVTHTPVATGAPCADGNACNGAETCNAAGTCVAGTPPSVDDGNPCTLDSCSASSGVSHTPVAQGTSCADGNACNGTEACNDNGSCVAGTPVSCVASDQCHVAGTCNTSTGACSNPAKPDGAACSDDNACTQADACQAGACASGIPVATNDGNPCTTDSCSPSSGVSHTPVATGTSCADADACDGTETCNAVGTCVAGTAPSVDDGNPCTIDGCDAVTGVSHTPVAQGTSCTDENACNGSETCNATGACVAGTPVSCVALDQCHDVGTCSPATGACTNPLKANGSTCADGDSCTQIDTCQAGSCVGSNPVTCTASDACHDAGTCNPVDGTCSNPAKQDGTTCPDDDICNGAETCQAGACTSGTPLAVDDGNPCTTDACSAAGGVTHTALANGIVCASGDACSSASTCSAGTCVPGMPANVDDGNPCTADSCDPSTGVAHVPVVNGSACGDGNLCNGEETCQAGSCTAGTPVDVDDGNPCTEDACSAISGVVTHTPVANSTSCADADTCNGAETCVSGACAPGTPLAIDDENPCTNDTCSSPQGVTHTPTAAGSSCTDFDLCNGAETCNGAGTCTAGTPVAVDTTNPCSVGSCDPLTGTVTYTPSPVGTYCLIDVCTAGACNPTGECTAAGSTLEDDGDPCTIEWCDPELGLQQKQCSTIDRTVSTTLYRSMRWIFEEPNPVQVGMAPGTIVVERATILRGLVKTRDGSPLPGANVTILDRPEFGRTVTRADGYFDMVVNGGGTLIVNYERDGYLSVQRSRLTVWGQCALLPELVMIPPDPVVTPIDLEDASEPFQVAQASAQVDADGTRQGTLLIPSGVEATMHFPDGTTEPLTTMNVRITEFTVGPDGQKAMPGELPPESKYTYAFEVNADEAVEDGAESITFSTPLTYYVDNFLNFPAGTIVPVGSFDRAASAWKAEPNGIVLDVVGESGGLAQVDVTGDGLADAGAALAVHGITATELKKLADLYDPGQSIWRTPIAHFTEPWDNNWGGGPPDDAIYPNGGSPTPEPTPRCDNAVPGQSLLACPSQTLYESLPIAGTPYSLNYSSARVPGRTAANRLHIPLSGSSLPPSLSFITLDVSVAGTSVRTGANGPNRSYDFSWDGRDAFGRVLQGSQIADIRVNFVYPYVSKPTAAFGYNGNGGAIAVGRGNILLEQVHRMPIGAFDASALGFGGWTLDVQHTYEQQGRRLQLGDGKRIDASALSPAIVQQIPLGSVSSGVFTIAPDGAVYSADAATIRRVSPGATPTAIAGVSGNVGYGGDGLPANDPAVRFSFITDVQLGRDGSVYLADRGNHLVRRIEADGIVRRIAGVPGSVNGAPPDGPATSIALNNPKALAVATDGTVFVATNRNIHRIGTDGHMIRVAGRLASGFAESPDDPIDGTPATEPRIEPHTIALAPNGTMYAVLSVASGGIGTPYGRIVKFEEGRVYNVAGNNCFNCNDWVDGAIATQSEVRPSALTFDAEGKLYFLDDKSDRVASISTDGRLYTQAGGLANLIQAAFGVPATRTNLFLSSELAFGPNGLYLNALDSVTLFRVGNVLPGDTGTAFVLGARDAQAFYSFDALGRHVSTRHSLTGSNLVTFGYGPQSLITTVTDEAGKVTTIERDSSGDPQAIVAPFGQRTELALSPDGYLSDLTDPEGGHTHFGYDPGGLLTSLTDARGLSSTMSYGGYGHLTYDLGPDSTSQVLARTENGTTWDVTRSTSGGRQTTYSTNFIAPSRQISTVTTESGNATITTISPDQTVKVQASDGTVTTTSETPDARFGLNAPVRSRTITLPSSLASTTSSSRTYPFLNPQNFLDFSEVVDESVVNGQIWRTRYNRNARTFTTTSPVGRSTVRTIDTLGRTTRLQVAGLSTPTDFTYDSSGRLQSVIQGSRLTTNAYHPLGNPAAGYLAGVTDALTTATTFTRDALGRPQTETRAGATAAFSWDPMSNLTSVTPPGKPAHGMTYTAGNLLQAYNPPPAGLPASSTGYTYDLDRMPLTETRPTGQAIARAFDTFGRPDTVAIPGGLLDRDYYPPGGNGGGKLSDLRGPYGTDLHFTYDGMLTKSVTWSGDVAGSVAWNYNTNFNKSLETVNGTTGSAQAVFGYDNDQLLSCASPTTCSPAGADALRLVRSPQNGLISSIVLGNTSEALTYNSVGELATQNATYSSSPLVNITYHGAGAAARDALGRIVQKTEVIGGATKVYGYTYDARRRLTDVTVNGVLEEHFEYDANGNRTVGFSATTGLSSTGVYDDQDRLLSYGPFDYTYTANGELETKTNRDTGDAWLFQYDALGNLMTVGLPNGDLVEYLVDGMGRRVGKQKNGVLLKQWIYRDALKPVAELDASGALVAEFVYASKSNVPDYVRRGSATYRVVSDHLGSPRHVVNVANSGDVPFTASYSSFGEVTGTGLDWMPFGFAGGIYDSDTKIIRFGTRDFDSTIGRWISKEPLRFKAGRNFYAYAWNDPINLFDPTGLSPQGAGGAWGNGEGGGEGSGSNGGPHMPPHPLPMDGVDWCGSGWNGPYVPERDALGTASVQNPCMHHDECYGTCGAEKADCDAQLASEMSEACSAQGDACYIAAGTYWFFVWAGGKNAFNDAQASCVCQ